MTVIAVIAAGDVRRVLAACNDAVMTGAARAQHLRVVDRENRRPHIAAVTVLANIARLYVRGALARGFGAVVAAEAIARDVDMIEIRR